MSSPRQEKRAKSKLVAAAVSRSSSSTRWPMSLLACFLQPPPPPPLLPPTPPLLLLPLCVDRKKGRVGGMADRSGRESRRRDAGRGDWSEEGKWNAAGVMSRVS
jgi:hypothetical protein